MNGTYVHVADTNDAPRLPLCHERDSTMLPVPGRPRSYAPPMAIDFLAHLRVDSARFAEVLTASPPDAPVPTCGEWTAADLLWHLGEVQHFFGTIVHDRLTDTDGYTKPGRPADFDALVHFFHESSALLIDSLAATPDEVAVWTWLDSDQSVGFIRRRQAHEALIHRLDAELTAGSVTALDPTLATDGVLEAIEWMFGEPPSWAMPTWDGPIGRLATSDTDAGWLVQVGSFTATSPNTGTVYTDEGVLRLAPSGEAAGRAPQFEITGTAADLDAWMWSRPTIGRVTLSGDATAFEAVVRAGVQ